jgi:hypothetical protein
MANQFGTFAKAVDEAFKEFSKGELFVVEFSKDELWEEYLGAFPIGTNDLFRKRSYHDCSCCRNFIKNAGVVVKLEGAQLVSLWSKLEVPYPYDVVAAKLASLVEGSKIRSIYRTKEKQYGSEFTNELTPEKTVIRWNHFVAVTDKKHFSTKVGELMGRAEAAKGVLKRGLDDFKIDHLTTVIDLIKEGLYRGKEFEKSVTSFLKLATEYAKLNSEEAKENFCWANYLLPEAMLRNTVIGSLLQDLAANVEFDKAVKSYEAKVAPANYKRPKPLISQSMVKQAEETLEKEGLLGALHRRFARVEDVSVNDVLFVDNKTQSKMKGGLQDLLGAEVQQKKVEIKDPVVVSSEEFLATILPKAKKISVVLSANQANNFVSLTAPENSDEKQLFKWGNNFAWSYKGELADSDLTAKVAERGGRVDGVFRFSHMWNYDERNASLMDLHVFMPGNGHTDTKTNIFENYGIGRRVGWNKRNDTASGGVQDVDYTSEAPKGYVPVENITFPSLGRMPEGKYICKVHNWQLRAPTKGGFRAEIAFGGQVFKYEHKTPMAHKQWVTVAEVTLKAGEFTIKHHLQPTTGEFEIWGVKSGVEVPVNFVCLSPNHWGENKAGAKHVMFMLDNCKNPEEVRGFYNEFLNTKLEKHRKVFEVLGSKLKCKPTENQLSGVGFTSGRKDSLTVLADYRPYSIQF